MAPSLRVKIILNKRSSIFFAEGGIANLFLKKYHTQNTTDIQLSHVPIPLHHNLNNNTTMDVKTLDQMLVCGKQVRASISTLKEHVGTTPEALMVEIASQGIQPVGPQIWYYSGCVGNWAEAQFDLLISIPVASAGANQNGFEFLSLPSYKCVSMLHKGAWDKLPQAYEVFIREINEAGLIMVGTSREVYINCDFENQENCITEIQMEVQ